MGGASAFGRALAVQNGISAKGLHDRYALKRQALDLQVATCCGKPTGACCHGMTDDSDHHKDVNVVISMLNAVYCRDGADMAVHTAKLMIAAAAALVTVERGPDETRRILQIVGMAQGKAS